VVCIIGASLFLDGFIFVFWVFKRNRLRLAVVVLLVGCGFLLADVRTHFFDVLLFALKAFEQVF